MLDDYYAVLGVAPNADLDTIRQAYRAKASANHPDHGGSHAQMLRINEAWTVLRNPGRLQSGPLWKSPRDVDDQLADGTRKSLRLAVYRGGRRSGSPVGAALAGCSAPAQCKYFILAWGPNGEYSVGLCGCLGWPLAPWGHRGPHETSSQTAKSSQAGPGGILDHPLPRMRD